MPQGLLRCCWMAHLLFYEIPVAMHGQVHKPDGAVIDKGISVLAVQVRLTAHCEDHACMSPKYTLRSQSNLA